MHARSRAVGFTSPERRNWTYRSWEAMKDRCLNPKHPRFKDYGGRGITICTRWRESFHAFAVDVGERTSADLFLDRIDNDGGYEPGNVRWATRSEQQRNTRNSRHLTANGVTHTLAEWSETTGISSTTIRERIIRGWSIERALFTPLPNRKSDSARPFVVGVLCRARGVRREVVL